jgi:hypothetical protein
MGAFSNSSSVQTWPRIGLFFIIIIFFGPKSSVGTNDFRKVTYSGNQNQYVIVNVHSSTEKVARKDNLSN